MARYVESENIAITDDERQIIARLIERKLESKKDKPSDDSLTPEQRKSGMIGWRCASLMDWKVCKALYEKYGGRVGFGSLGAWTAFDGQNKLIREHVNAGDIKFHNEQIEEAFWQHTKIDNFSDAYPKGEYLQKLLASPPHLRQ